MLPAIPVQNCKKTLWWTELHMNPHVRGYHLDCLSPGWDSWLVKCSKEDWVLNGR